MNKSFVDLLLHAIKSATQIFLGVVFNVLSGLNGFPSGYEGM